MVKKKRTRFHEHGHHDDIKYRGPLSYQEFQIFGWLCIVLTVASMLISLGSKLDPRITAGLSGVQTVISNIGNLSLPFLLIANFARILNNSEGYKKQLIRNGLAMAAIALVSIILLYRYVIGAFGQLLTDPSLMEGILAGLLSEFNPKGFIAFNIFVDLFLCTLFMYFLNARPKRFFTGKKIFLFRAFAILPIAYEAYVMLIKVTTASGAALIPFWLYPLLTVKPPMTFLVFMVLSIYIKTREWRYCRHGKTHEDYQAFLQTNRNSFHFSVFTAITLVIASILDLLILVSLIGLEAGTTEKMAAMTSSETSIFNSIGWSIGFGESFPLFLVAPFMLLFSYTRIPKRKELGMFIAPVGIVIILILILEAFRLLLGNLPIEKIDVVALIESAENAEASPESQQLLMLLQTLFSGG